MLVSQNPSVAFVTERAPIRPYFLTGALAGGSTNLDATSTARASGIKQAASLTGTETPISGMGTVC